MRKTRTFIAVEMPQYVHQRAADLIDRLRTSVAHVHWVEPKNMHITLKFLGDQTDEELVRVCRAVTDSVRDLAPFEFCCQGAGAFPNGRHPRTLWLGVRDGVDALRGLQQRVDAELTRHGYPRERRAFHPHLTLGRVQSAGPAMDTLAQLLTEAVDWEAGRVATGEVLVFSSLLQRGGPLHEVLARAPLGG